MTERSKKMICPETRRVILVEQMRALERERARERAKNVLRDFCKQAILFLCEMPKNKTAIETAAKTCVSKRWESIPGIKSTSMSFSKQGPFLWLVS